MIVRGDIVRKLAEVAILFGSLFAIDHLLLNGNAFAGIEPNPYWIPVLVLAMAYGTGMGLAAATIASTIWISAPHQLPNGMDRIGEQHYLSILPLLWTMAALLIGEVTAGRKSRYDRLSQRYEELSQDWEKAAATFANLSEINRELQIRIALEQRIGGQAIAAAEGLVQPDQASQTEALTKLISLAVLSEDFTYYQVRGDRLVAQLQGAAAQERPLETTQLALTQTMLKQPRIIHVRQERGRALLKDLGVAAVPVRDDRSGALTAILVIHTSSKLRFDAAKLAELSQVGQAIGGYANILTRPHSINLVDCDFVEGKVA